MVSYIIQSTQHTYDQLHNKQGERKAEDNSHVEYFLRRASEADSKTMENDWKLLDIEHVNRNRTKDEEWVLVK